MNIKLNKHEWNMLQNLDNIVWNKPVIRKVDHIVTVSERKLTEDPETLASYKPVPLSIYGDRLPKTILSSWVFVLRANTITGAERHPNSHQRMMAYRGLGDIQILKDDKWLSNHLIGNREAEIKNR